MYVCTKVDKPERFYDTFKLEQARRTYILKLETNLIKFSSSLKLWTLLVWTEVG
jgi:hypothetical protein